MRIVIVGGGKVGYYTAKTLKEHGFEVHVIEINPQMSVKIANELDVPVFCADGTTVEALAQAGISKADALIAVSGNDEDNIVACQLAKKHFNVKRIISRANNPKNVEIMKLLGADIAVSSTQVITNLIEMEVDSELKLLATLNQGEAGIVEIVIPENFPAQKLSEIDLPRNCIIIATVHNDQMSIPRGDTILYPADHITAVVDRNSQKTFKKTFSAK
ncbi:MAG: TrkA family potassium uptake protein [Oscillospiraceae bacterium]